MRPPTAPTAGDPALPRLGRPPRLPGIGTSARTRSQIIASEAGGRTTRRSDAETREFNTDASPVMDRSWRLVHETARIWSAPGRRGAARQPAWPRTSTGSGQRQTPCLRPACLQALHLCRLISTRFCPSAPFDRSRTPPLHPRRTPQSQRGAAPEFRRLDREAALFLIIF